MRMYENTAAKCKRTQEIVHETGGAGERHTKVGTYEMIKKIISTRMLVECLMFYVR